MTDSEMKKILDSLADAENKLNEMELALSMMAAVVIADKQEIEKAEAVVSDDEWRRNQRSD